MLELWPHLEEIIIWAVSSVEPSREKTRGGLTHDSDRWGVLEEPLSLREVVDTAFDRFTRSVVVVITESRVRTAVHITLRINVTGHLAEDGRH